jgi:hypothetical protein
MIEAANTSETSVTSTRLHGATAQKTVMFIFAAVRTRNLTRFTCFSIILFKRIVDLLFYYSLKVFQLYFIMQGATVLQVKKHTQSRRRELERILNFVKLLKFVISQTYLVLKHVKVMIQKL